MNTDAPAADLGAVEREIIGFGAHFCWLSIEQRQIFIEGRGKRMVQGNVTLFLGVIFHQGKVHYPSQRVFVIWDQTKLFTEMQAQIAESVIDSFSRIGGK